MNTANANDDMGLMAMFKKLSLPKSGLFARLMTAAVIVPLVLGVVYLGSPYLDVFVGLVFLGALYEWQRCSLTVSHAHPFTAFAVGGYAYLLYTSQGSLKGCFLVSVMTLSVLLSWALARKLRGKAIGNVLIYGVGCLYLVLATASLIRLDARSNLSFEPLLWILLIIWASDCGAYFAGRLLKGPKLAPRISPNKTWSGLIGGTLVGGGMGFFFKTFVMTSALVPPYYFSIAVGIALIGHAGDLLESVCKRYFGIKDTGTILPGHGGLLDRLDSLLAVSLAIGMYFLITAGRL